MLEKIKGLSTWKKVIIGLIALISLPITVLVLGIDLLITGIKKKNNNKTIVGAVITIIMVGMFMNSTVAEEESIPVIEDTTVKSEVNEEDNAKEDNTSLFGATVVKPVLNGSNTEKIGDRLEVIYDNTEFTESNFLEFYNSTVKDESYNYVNIKIDKKTGIIFPGCLNYFYYGTIDEDGIIIDELGSGEVKDDSVVYNNTKE